MNILYEIYIKKKNYIYQSASTLAVFVVSQTRRSGFKFGKHKSDRRNQNRRKIKYISRYVGQIDF